MQPIRAKCLKIRQYFKELKSIFANIRRIIRLTMICEDKFKESLVMKFYIVLINSALN